MIRIVDFPLAAASDALLACWTAAGPSALGYHHPLLQHSLTPILGDEARALVGFDAKDVPIAALPYRVKTGPDGLAFNALPFFGPNGFVGDDLAAASFLITAFGKLAEQSECLSVVFYAPFLMDRETVANAFGPGTRITKFTQAIDLTHYPPWPPKRNADIKRAVNAGLTLRSAVPDDRNALIAFYQEGCAMRNIPPKPSLYLESMLALSADPTAPARFMVAVRKEIVVAGLLTVYGPQTMSYVMPIVDERARSDQPIALLIDDAARWFQSNGGRYFNFESSHRWDDDVFKFKARWGAEPYAYDIHIRPGPRMQTADSSHFSKAYPFYFVMPFGQISGTWPADHPL